MVVGKKNYGCPTKNTLSVLVGDCRGLGFGPKPRCGRGGFGVELEEDESPEQRNRNPISERDCGCGHLKLSTTIEKK